ncbi:MAG: permease prefix domain 1-containing protein [Terriglobia bacterium]|nr:permease prefix domain 1-containing protein [Terriglobia bacterium]
MSGNSQAVDPSKRASRLERFSVFSEQQMESHLQMHIEDNLRSGMTPEEMRRDAILKLGGVEQTK